MSRPAPGIHSSAPPTKGSALLQQQRGGGAQPQAFQTQQGAAAPTTPSAGPLALIKDLKGLLSQPVRISLEDGKQHIGLLWAFDSGIGSVVLEVPKLGTPLINLPASFDDYPPTAAAFPTLTLSSVKVAAQGGDSTGGRTNFQILKLQRVSKVERLQGPNATLLEKAKLTEISRDVNIAAAEARERAATGEAMKRAAKIGVGVSTLAQDVFDALSKTLPCRWADRHIIVMDEVVISPDEYDTATVPQYPLSTLQALADGKTVAGVPDDAKSKVNRWQRVAKVLDGERKKILAKNASST